MKKLTKKLSILNAYIDFSISKVSNFRLDEIRTKSNDPDWWYATRAMCAFVLVVAEEIGAKYIVPTDIAMVYGILDKGEI